MITAPWASRSLEQARLLNPAFLGTLLWSCARGYASTRTSFVAWLAENPRVHVGFAERATALVPLVKEAILFATNGGVLQLQETRVVAASRPRAMAKLEREASIEVNACIKKAEFVGKWFALSGDYTTVMALWGVAP